MQMVLLDQPLNLSARLLEAQLREHFGNSSISVTGSDGSMVVQWGKLAFAIMIMDLPIPAETFKDAVHRSYGTHNAEQLVAEHRAHIIVSPLTPPEYQGMAYFIAAGVMAISQIIPVAGTVLGYYWSSAQALVNPTGFQNALESVNCAIKKQANNQANAGYDLPATYWVGMCLFSHDDKTIGATSEGLEYFTGFELEIEPLAMNKLTLAETFFSCVSYIFNAGPSVKSGDTIGISERERFDIKMLEATETQPKRLRLTLVKNTVLSSIKKKVMA